MSFFITFEGVEGCGKSTQARLLGEYLASKGYPILMSREPGGTPIGHSIRKILLAPKNSGMDAYAELYLYLASRVQHIREIILPHLQKGMIVICDRFTDATRAYQGYGRGIPLSLIDGLHAQEPLSLKPDITFLLDLPHETGLQRARRRNTGKRSLRREGRFEDESTIFHEKVRAGYLQIARRERKRVKVVDASKSIRSVQREIIGIMDRFLSTGKGKRTP